MPRKLAATVENNAWRSRKRVVADYVPECMRHHANSRGGVVPQSSPRANGAVRKKQSPGAGNNRGFVCTDPEGKVTVREVETGTLGQPIDTLALGEVGADN